MISIRDALSLGRLTLKQSSDTFVLDAEILLSKIIGCNKAYLYTYPEKILSHEQYAEYLSLINSRLNGTPIAYLTGEQEFWSMPFKVSSATLIPRPETELLVEKALEICDANKICKILELGTGSGAISISLAKERPNWQIFAVEKSHEALEIAKKNAAILGVSNIKFVLSDWFSKIDELRFNLIISNPPYIAKDDPHLCMGDVKFEPREALIGGDNGLESLQYIITHSYHYLLANGRILLEHGYDQKIAVERMLTKRGYVDIACFQDLQGNSRVSFGLKL